MATPGDKKVRPVLTLPQIYHVHELLEQILSTEQEPTQELVEVKANFKFILLKEEFGLLKGIGTVGVPRPARQTQAAELGFPELSPVTVIKNNADKQAPTIEQEEALFAQIQAIEEENKKILEAGGKLPELDNLLLDPSFNFSKD